VSVHVLSAFMEESRSALGARLVGMVLSDAAGDDGIVWLGQEKIAARAHLSERGVRDALRRLEELGELETRQAKRGRARVNVYRLRLGAAVPQYERLPFVVDDPFSEHDRQILPVVDDRQIATRRPADRDRDDRQIAAAPPYSERKGNVREPAAVERPRDLVWDDLERRFGKVAPKTNAHAKRNRAVADLKRLEATPETIAEAVRAWPALFPGATITDAALATHYPQLYSAKTERRQRIVTCEECGIGGGLHLAECSLAGVAA